MFIRLRFDVGRIGIKNISSYQLPVDTLLQDVVKDLLSNVIVPESPYSVGADCCVIRPLLC